MLNKSDLLVVIPAFIASNLGVEVVTSTNNSGYESSINQGFKFALSNNWRI